MPKIVHLAYSRSASTPSSYIIYSKMYLRTPGRLSSPLYIVRGPFTVMLSRNGKVWYRMYYSRILVIILTNWATEFIPPIGTVVCLRSPRGIIKAIRFLLFILSSN